LSTDNSEDETSLSEQLAEKIHSLREDLKLSREKFAEVLGVAPRRVGRWERAEATPTGGELTLLDLLRESPERVAQIRDSDAFESSTSLFSSIDEVLASDNPVEEAMLAAEFLDGDEDEPREVWWEVLSLAGLDPDEEAEKCASLILESAKQIYWSSIGRLMKRQPLTEEEKQKLKAPKEAEEISGRWPLTNDEREALEDAEKAIENLLNEIEGNEDIFRAASDPLANDSTPEVTEEILHTPLEEVPFLSTVTNVMDAYRKDLERFRNKQMHIEAKLKKLEERLITEKLIKIFNKYSSRDHKNGRFAHRLLTEFKLVPPDTSKDQVDGWYTNPPHLEDLAPLYNYDLDDLVETNQNSKKGGSGDGES
jgi:DNA-binding transcriptional regulator YiaG